MLDIPGRFSANPLICLTPYSSFSEKILGDEVTPQTSINQTLIKSSSRYNVSGSPYLARICNIYLNINNVVNILDNTKRDEDGSPLLTFLNAIIKSFTEALGGINEITIKVDQNTQQVKFIENTPQRLHSDNTTDQEFATFNVFGVTTPNGEGSFVRNIDMKGSISSDFASMITIGAQSNGNKVSSNATGFSTYNSGLIDRVIPKRNNAFTGTADDEKKEEKSITTIWGEINARDTITRDTRMTT